MTIKLRTIIIFSNITPFASGKGDRYFKGDSNDSDEQGPFGLRVIYSGIFSNWTYESN